MKVILNAKISELLEDIQKQFPDGTAMTHIVNIAIRAYHQQLSSNKKDNNEDTGREDFKNMVLR